MRLADKKSDFRKKIKTVEELKQILGDAPRKKKVVMCHGVFDIVHPGHLRHLMYAKERGGTLVASLTCDAHIHKANMRPFVPQELRAINLAALEFVDYVIIDFNETPIKNIQLIKPDYFAKGFEYTSNGANPRTKEEMDVVESYGGEMLFTPGDIVYSSSSLIESAPPNLGPAKLQILMECENVTIDDLRATLDKFAGLKVHVIGDTIVDSYTYTRMIGGMTKTPTVSVQFEKQINYSGGAAVVAKHFKSAGADVTLSTVLGNDSLKDFVIDDLTRMGVKCQAIIDPTRPTTQKESILCQGYHQLRMSRVDNRIISEKVLKQLAQALATSDADAFVFCDYRHGIFHKTTIRKLVESVPKGAFKAADSQVASRWGNILEFQDFDLITPNEREARFALGDQDSTVRPLAMDLYKRAKCKVLMLTLGERGVMTYRENENLQRAFFTVDPFADHVADAVGAGDTLLSYATMALVSTKSEVIATILGSLAAAIAVEREGNNPVTREDVLKKLDSVEKLVKIGYGPFALPQAATA